MKYLTPFKLFEESIIKPTKKFPTEPAIHWNYLMDVLKEGGLDPHEDLVKGQRSTHFYDFCTNKCSKRDNVVFPIMIDSEGLYKDDNRYKNFIFGESVFLLPISYDPSNDAKEAIQKKKIFLDKMKDYAKQMGKSKAEQDKFIQDAEKHTHFGPGGYDWVNPALKTIHDKLGQYYKDGKLRVWFPNDVDDDDSWEGLDYPHKYNIVGDSDKSGVYYLSDIERYIDDKYGIKDDLFYQFIINNEYIEGRYWERVWSLSKDRNDTKNILKKSDFGEYGMEPTEDIFHMLNIIEQDFRDEIKSTKEGFPIYVDYYKKVEPKY